MWPFTPLLHVISGVGGISIYCIRIPGDKKEMLFFCVHVSSMGVCCVATWVSRAVEQFSMNLAVRFCSFGGFFPFSITS